MRALRPAARISAAVCVVPDVFSRAGLAGGDPRRDESELVTMSSIDPIANVITKIRNASRAKHATVDVPASKLITRVLEILKQEGFIRHLKPLGQPPKQQVRIYLKYGAARAPAILRIVRVSRQGQRIYRGTGELPRVMGGYGRSILTTSKGLMTDQEARRQRVGGEVLCHIW